MKFNIDRVINIVGLIIIPIIIGVVVYQKDQRIANQDLQIKISNEKIQKLEYIPQVSAEFNSQTREISLINQGERNIYVCGFLEGRPDFTLTTSTVAEPGDIPIEQCAMQSPGTAWTQKIKNKDLAMIDVICLKRMGFDSVDFMQPLYFLVKDDMGEKYIINIPVNGQRDQSGTVIKYNISAPFIKKGSWNFNLILFEGKVPLE